jgi:deazaflavin-dependent oxidoreductase (nitroreductase family)
MHDATTTAPDDTKRPMTAGEAEAAGDWSTAQRLLVEEIRTNGHAVTGRFEGQQVLALTTTGAQSGALRTSPLAYSRSGDAYVVTASKGGAPDHPAWYHNLLKDPTASIDVGLETIPVRARVAEGPERQRLWERHIALHPQIGDYPKKTDRVIPIVVLEPITRGQDS